MRTRFQQEMEELREKLLRMGGLAELAVDRACQAYSERDLTRCQMVLENESLINAAEREIDELAFDILATQQPAAIDLRFILAVTKINSDLERVGDQAVNIAERVMDLIELPVVELPVDIARMATAVGAMVRRALESFVEGKAELAQAVLGDGSCRGPDARRSFYHARAKDERTAASDSAGAGCSSGRTQSRARGRPCHQHRRRRYLLGSRR